VTVWCSAKTASHSLVTSALPRAKITLNERLIGLTPAASKHNSAINETEHTNVYPVLLLHILAWNCDPLC
jgi:hypothetical protein